MTVTSNTDARRAFFDRLADEWDAQQPPDREAVLRRLLAPFAGVLGAAQTLLEVGTGTGALIPPIREMAPAARTISVDLSYRMLRRARMRCPNALLLQADAHALPLASGTVDLVICHNVFPHFQDKPAALAELGRILGDGGYLLILHEVGREQVNRCHRQVGGAVGNDFLPPGERVAQMLAEAQFGEIRVKDTADQFQAVARRTARAERT